MKQSAAALKLTALSDLLYESIQFGEHEQLEQLVQRAHVRRILLLIRPRQALERQQLAAAMGLKDSNLSNVLGVMSSAGLINREQSGKWADFRLTRSGEDERAALAQAARLGRPKRRRDREDDVVVKEKSGKGAAGSARVRRVAGRRYYEHLLGRAGTIDHDVSGLTIRLVTLEASKPSPPVALVEKRRAEVAHPDFVPRVERVVVSSPKTPKHETALERAYG